VEDEGEVGRSVGRRIGIAALLAGGVGAAALIAGYVERKPIVRHFVDRELAAAHVPATYTLAAIGPFSQRLENVRIGDPAHPDLVAKRIDIDLGYGLHGPHLAAVRMDGVRLDARVVDGKVSLGAIDRLMPRSQGQAPFALPDMRVDLSDTRIALDTPAGAIGAVVEGTGNLSDGFRGRISALAPLLAAGGCAVRSVSADVHVTIAARKPHLQGPLRLAALACPSQGLTLGEGKATLDMDFAAALDRWSGGLSLAGFRGGASAARFSQLSGLVTLTGDAKAMQGNAGVTLADLVTAAGTARKAELGGPFRYVPSASGLIFSGDAKLTGAALDPGIRRRIAVSTDALAATPLGPVAKQAVSAAGRLVADADGDARLSLTLGGPLGTALKLRRLRLHGRDGGLLEIDEGAGIGWQARERAWRLDGHVRTSGGGLPTLDALLRQAKAGGPVEGVATLADYRTGTARLAMTPLRFTVAGHTTRFETVASLDGPLGSGRVEGLRVPLNGRFDLAGGFEIDRGCTPLGVRSLRFGGIALDPTTVRLCGEGGGPLAAKRPGGALQYGATAADLHIAGRTGTSPLTIASGRASIGASGLDLADLSVAIGEGDAVTSLNASHVAGRFADGGMAGTLEGAEARIAHVPLLLNDIAGAWTLKGGALALDGGITVADAADAPRFHPLVARDAKLAFADSRIDATATLREPKSDATVSDVVIAHDLGSGTGHATLAVPGLDFAPKGLQPEALTPLTLGVIANVQGKVAGEGRIDWTGEGVTSSGRFATEGLDLAAAFGPVTKLAGTIRFSDLLGLVTPPHQEVTIAEVNPGVAVSNGVVHFRLPGAQQVEVEDAAWPFAGGALTLEPTLLSFEERAQRHLTFRVKGLDAAAFVQQLAFPNMSATGVFDGVLPMIFDQTGGRITQGELVARKGGGTIAYVGELTNAQLGSMGKMAFDALKAIRYRSLVINLDGRLDGEIISRVKFDGIRQATADRSLAARLISNLPFRFNIAIRAPFRGLLGSARAFVDPSTLLDANGNPIVTPPPAPDGTPQPIQPSDSETVR
jgi:translocation and assembly module TamB